VSRDFDEHPEARFAMVIFHSQRRRNTNQSKAMTPMTTADTSVAITATAGTSGE
jgi:hypothetical protein